MLIRAIRAIRVYLKDLVFETAKNNNKLFLFLQHKINISRKWKIGLSEKLKRKTISPLLK